MVTIRRAEALDIDQLVVLEGALFAVDAVVHEPLVDPTWPARAGRQDFERLLADDRSLVLVSELAASEAVGLLVGYLATSSPTRLPATYAVLRSLYVKPAQQRSGVASALVEQFLGWARNHGCAEAHVDAYAANVGARAFYERHGFAARSVSRVLEL